MSVQLSLILIFIWKTDVTGDFLTSMLCEFNHLKALSILNNIVFLENGSALLTVASVTALKDKKVHINLVAGEQLDHTY